MGTQWVKAASVFLSALVLQACAYLNFGLPVANSQSFVVAAGADGLHRIIPPGAAQDGWIYAVVRGAVRTDTWRCRTATGAITVPGGLTVERRFSFRDGPTLLISFASLDLGSERDVLAAWEVWKRQPGAIAMLACLRQEPVDSSRRTPLYDELVIAALRAALPRTFEDQQVYEFGLRSRGDYRTVELRPGMELGRRARRSNSNVRRTWNIYWGSTVPCARITSNPNGSGLIFETLLAKYRYFPPTNFEQDKKARRVLFWGDMPGGTARTYFYAILIR